MLTEERHQLILDWLEKNNTVKLQEIVDRTGASESTVRRDLNLLEERGLCIRVHGGAKRKYSLSAEPEMKAKSNLYIEDKQEIAQKAATFVQDKDVIFLDAGSTTYEMIPFLQDKDITVVTNGVPHGSLLADLGIQSILLGGRIKASTKATIGQACIHQLEGYRFSKTFLGMNGIDLNFGHTTPDTEEAAVKQTALSQSAQSFVLADASKFQEVTFAKVADLEDSAIITTNLNDRLMKNVAEITTILEA